MHILYLHQYFVPPDGAGGTRSYEFARRFVARGHRVSLVTSSAFFPPSYAFDRRVSRLELDGIDIRVIRIPYSNRLGYARRMAAFAEFAMACAGVASGLPRADVVLATSTPLTIAFPGIVAKRRHRAPLVFEVRDLWPELPIAIGALKNPIAKWAARLLERVAYRASERIVALSPGMKAGIEATGFPGERIHVIPNGCDLDLFGVPGQEALFPAALRRDAGPIVMYAGTLGRINGVSYLVDIAAEVRDLAPDVRFVIAGDGAERERVVARARETGTLGTTLFVLDPFPKHLMPRVLASATLATSLFVDLPAMWNNSANKFFDALAAGAPVMINYSGWHADLLRQSGAGIAVPASDARGAAAELLGLLRDPRRVARARAAAARLARTRFDRDELAERMCTVLEAAARRGNPEEETVGACRWTACSS